MARSPILDYSTPNQIPAYVPYVPPVTVIVLTTEAGVVLRTESVFSTTVFILDL